MDALNLIKNQDNNYERAPFTVNRRFDDQREICGHGERFRASELLGLGG